MSPQTQAVVAEVKTLLKNGVAPAKIRAQLGLTKPRYYRILDRLNISHDNAGYQSRRFIGPAGWLASDVPMTCGRGDRLLEIVHVLVTVLRSEEQQEVEL